MIIRNIKNTFLSIGKSLDGPVFVKEFADMEHTLHELNDLKSKANDADILKSIEQDQLYIRLGAEGEKNVHYELKNSFLPMYLLHDVRIQQDDYSAQLDFVILTSKFICILETKKLNGDISINAQGDFTRSFKSSSGKIYKKEGMYSPISQNQRHVRILQDMLIKNKMIKNAPVLSLVVMANPKSIIDYKYAPKEIKDQIIKYDQLTPYLKKMLSKPTDINMPIATMTEIAEFLINQHVEAENTFVKKYEKMIAESCGTTVVADAIEPPNVSEPIVITEVKKEIVTQQEEPTEDIKNESPDRNVDAIREKLVAYRKEQSKKENVAAYMIFNNIQMEDVISKLPKDSSELLKCNGFGPVKVEKYGDVVLGIVNGK